MLSVLKQFVNQKSRVQIPHAVVPGPHAQFSGPPGGATPAPTLESLSGQLAELQRRSCDVLGHPLVKHPAAGSLHRLGNVLLVIVLRMQKLWRAARAGGLADPTAADMRDLLQASHRLLDVIVAQVDLCRSTARHAATVAEWGRRLAAHETVRFQALLPLVNRICDEVRHFAALRALTPVSGISLTALVESQTAGTDAATFVAGLTTARVLAWSLDDDQRIAARLPLLILAGLFQDVGRLSLAGARAPRLEPHADWRDRQHPALGAALFGPVRGAPPELVLMIAQHHEQLDGGGFPRSLPAAEILPDSAILATAARFAELCLGQTHDVPMTKTLDYAKSRAIQTLVSEAEWSKWPLDFARRLAQLVAAERAEDAPLPIVTGDEMTIPTAKPASEADRELQLHDQEPGLPGGHSDPPSVRRNNAPRRAIVIRQP